MKKYLVSVILILTVISLSLLCLFLWALIFDSFYLSYIMLIVMVVFLPFGVKSKKFWIIRTLLFSFTLLLLLFTYHIPVDEINQHINYLRTKLHYETSLAGFSTKDKLGIYGLNILMGLAAYPIYPEASQETLLMLFPSPPNGIREFNSDFALKSINVLNITKQIKQTLMANKTTNTAEFNYYIQWNAEDYVTKEARYALALNTTNFSAIARRHDSSWELEASLKVRVEYPKRSYVILISNPELKVEEGLFWVLQKTGWLHPYTANWKFKINYENIED